jgi:hypothetical protein
MAQDKYRSSTGTVHSGGSKVVNNTFGQETMSETSIHGHDITFDGQTSSFFCPTNDQEKILGESFSDVQGHRSVYTKRTYNINSGSTIHITAGEPTLFDKNNPILPEYIDLRGELAAVHCAPTLAVGGQTNNTGTTFPTIGSFNSEGGSVEGGKFKELNIKNKYSDFVLSKSSRMTELEQKMGEGGDMTVNVAKDILISAGAVPIPIDSGYINPKGSQVLKSLKIIDTSSPLISTYASTPSFAGKDTYSTIPFGKVNIVASNKLYMNVGPGGFEVNGIGQIKLAGKGLSYFSGAQVNLVSTGTTYINSGGAIIVTGTNFNVFAPDAAFTGNASIKEDVVIGGNLEVAGKLTVYGDIICKGKIIADGDIISGGISLQKHVHGGGPPPS